MTNSRARSWVGGLTRAPGAEPSEEFSGRVRTGTGELGRSELGRSETGVGAAFEVVELRAGRASGVDSRLRVRDSRPRCAENERFAVRLPACSLDVAQRDPEGPA